ncbi:MAG: FHA domain-containing protein [Lachnospiraceae bacterium]|nr:FHA domain-containing protein [Lachnospiraceae bacterium]
MNEEYIRDMNKNYMILPADGCRDYQLRMFIENRIPGLLKGEIREINGEEKIYYNISSRQPLSRVFMKKNMSFEDIRNVFRSLDMLNAQLCKYLLDSANCLYDPDFCYMDLESGKVEWVFYPIGDTGSFLPIAEYMLEHVDHRDSEAVEGAFYIYKKAKSDNFVFSEVIDFLETMYSQLEMKEKSEKEEKRKSYETVSSRIKEESDATKKNSKGLDLEKMTESIKKKFDAILHKEDELNKDLYNIPSPSSYEEYDYMDELAKETGKKEVINDRKTDEEEFYGKTELVYSASNAEKILKARTKKYKDIELTRFPFVIGKIPDMVDEIIDHKTISRIHARFILSEDGNTVFMQDLNSQNGTFKNGLRLDANEMVSVSPGDEISFAGVQYVYE